MQQRVWEYGCRAAMKLGIKRAFESSDKQGCMISIAVLSDIRI